MRSELRRELLHVEEKPSEVDIALDFIRDNSKENQETHSAVLLTADYFYKLGLEHAKRSYSGEETPTDEILRKIKEWQCKYE